MRINERDQEQREAGRNLAIGVGSVAFPVLCVFIIATMAFHLAADVIGSGTDDSDLDGRHRSGMAVYTDHKTGLQYLATQNGGITPRLDVDGHQIRETHR